MTINTAVAPTTAATAATTGAGSSASSASSGGGAATGSTSTSSVNASVLSLNNGLASLAGNFQSFLSLLTTQLRNQDPLNPTDTNQFTMEITQMTGVEQQLLSNQLLQQLVNQQTGVAAAANLIGETITAPGATSGASPITGVVSAVQQVNGQTMLTVGNNQVPLNSVTGVAGGSNPLAALLGGG
jgi:flagellar basal-body rod modification protein FlgD